MTALKATTKLDKFRRSAEVTRKRAERPWEKLDRNAPAANSTTLRTNDYEDALIDYVLAASPVKTSRHAVIKRILVAGLLAEVNAK